MPNFVFIGCQGLFFFCGGHVLATIVAGFNPALVHYWGHNQRGFSGWLPHLFRRGDFLMGFPFVDFQTILSFEIKITLVTLKAFALLLRVLVGFQTSCRRLRGGFLQKKLLPSLCISSQCWRTHLVPWRRGFLPPQWSWIQWLDILRIWISRRKKIV